MADPISSGRLSYVNITEEEEDEATEEDDVYKTFQTAFSFKSTWKCAHCGSTNVTSVNTDDNCAKFQVDCTAPGTSITHIQGAKSMPFLVDGSVTGTTATDKSFSRSNSHDSILTKPDITKEVDPIHRHIQQQGECCPDAPMKNLVVTSNAKTPPIKPARSMEYLNQGWEGEHSLGVGEQMPTSKSEKKTVRPKKDGTQKGTKRIQGWYQSWRNTFRGRTAKKERQPIPQEMRNDKQELKSKLRNMGYDEDLVTVAANKYNNVDQASAYIKSMNGIRQIKEADKRQKVHQLMAAKAVPTLEKAILVIQIMELGYEENSAILAVQDCDTINEALAHLNFECQMCYQRHQATQMVSLYCCNHSCCAKCVRNYFLKIIKEQPILNAICPVCKKPDFQEKVDIEYFNHLGNQLKRIIDAEDYELFQTRLRTKALEANPCFKWCQKCDYGFVYEAGARHFKCPNCSFWVCLRCGKEWKMQHESLSCETYAVWLSRKEPQLQSVPPNVHLDSYGLYCPSCKFQYESIRRSCLYFICTQCKFEFCTGCGASFVEGGECQPFIKCKYNGLHAHHARSCHFYLRDRTPFDLQNLLLLYRVKFVWDTPLFGDSKLRGRCPAVEQHSDGRKDEICGRHVKAKQAGLCQKHYIEYLISLISKHGVDPAELFDVDELRAELAKHRKVIPMKRNGELKENYRRRLLEMVKCEIPLAGSLNKGQVSSAVLI